MAVTFTLCASRRMLSSVCLLRMSLAFQLSMLNALSDMVEVGAGQGRGEGVRGCSDVPQGVHIQSLSLR